MPLAIHKSRTIMPSSPVRARISPSPCMWVTHVVSLGWAIRENFAKHVRIYNLSRPGPGWKEKVREDEEVFRVAAFFQFLFAQCGRRPEIHYSARFNRKLDALLQEGVRAREFLSWVICMMRVPRKEEALCRALFLTRTHKTLSESARRRDTSIPDGAASREYALDG